MLAPITEKLLGWRELENSLIFFFAGIEVETTTECMLIYPNVLKPKKYIKCFSGSYFQKLMWEGCFFVFKKN